jgi:uncharacterized repeat protein (TIGR02543 family)
VTEAPRRSATRAVASLRAGALLALLAVVILPSSARADDAFVDDILFQYTPGSGVATATWYTGAGGAVVIPDTIPVGEEEYAVTAIGATAFQSRDVTALTLPAGLISIGSSAFSDNPSLTAVTLPASLRTIAMGAFFRCALTELTIPSGVTEIGDNAFTSNALSDLTIEGTPTIGQYAFTDNRITGLVLPEGVDSVGYSAFSSNRLTSVQLPSTLRTLPDFVFASNQLANVSLPSGLDSIGAYAFAFNLLTGVAVPDTVTSIGSAAFFSNAPLTSVTIGSGVGTIGDSAFAGATALRTVTFEGGAPVAGTATTGRPFGDGTGLTVYYRPGAEGFESPTWHGYASQGIGFFQVAFDANGGTGAMAPESSATPAALTPNAFTRSGYAFAGWNTASDGSGTAYADGAMFPFAADTTLYAQWQPDSVPVVPELSAGVSDAGGRMTVTVTGSGFTPGEPVIVVLHSDPVVLGTLVADAAGNVSGSFVIPAGTPAGAHTVVATGTLSGVQASVAIVVPADPAALAATGADPYPALGWGTAAVLLGALALLLRRRRAA